MASAVFGVRGDQGGLHVAGLRLVWSAGLMTRSVDVVVSLDRQIGAGDRVLDSEGNPATWSEWLASARVGHRFALGPDLWLRTTAGLSLVHADVTGTVMGTTSAFDVGRSNLGLDAVVAIAWRTGRVASSLVTGVTAVPLGQELVVGTGRFVLPPRLEPWIGLGAGLVF
ncbi:MAG: hypothetical protein IPL61_39735 [Myxococcales bacterium]|nr:hypothetical protein [Myxococcales bacterium]